ncbi:unnamed protein product [Brachionus calyciflorus]|uniref:SET domain-containing protein n=1 Tax=Brachionus calyciflorus TaxID=104777 RepID=A0A813NAI4_9BILA|nr:unnamed protein product [Brachionus calyciflorus]
MNSLAEESLAIFKKIEENEKKNRNLKPFLRPGSISFFEHDLRIRLFKQSSMFDQAKDSIQIKETYTCIKKHACFKKWDELKKITLKEMYVNKVHEGRYLEAKIAYEPFCVTSIQTLIQDENGDLEKFSVYNLNSNYDEDPKLLLPLGSTIRIKEPFLKLAADESITIRVDSPSDLEIVILADIPKSIQDDSIFYEKFNKEGNEFFSQKKFLQAIRSYTKALTLKNCVKSYSNRALAYLKLECFQSSFLDAEKSVHLEPNEKGYFRLGLSLYNMRQFEKSLEQFEKCLELNSQNKEAKQEIEKCHKRIQETKGIYDFSYLIRNSGKDNLRIDVADYVSDKIEIIDIPKKGKGVIAKVDIPKNTLLVGSKALSISYDCEFILKYVLVAYNLLNRTLDMNSRCQNLLNLIYKMRNDPFLSEKVYSLYAGKNFDRDFKMDPSIIDTERIENIQSFNSFKSDDFRFVKEPILDNSGVWFIPSFFNHSCIGNTVRIFFSDFVIIYTKRDIKEGEELTLSYLPLKSYEEREKKLQQYGFKCRCELCELDRKDGKLLKKREEMLKNIDKLKEKYDSKKWLNLIEKIRETYKERDKYKYELIRPVMYLSISLLKELKFDQAYRYSFELFEIAKECGDDAMAYSCAQKLSEYSDCILKPNDAEQWRKKADDLFPNDPFIKQFITESIIPV